MTTKPKTTKTNKGKEISVKERQLHCDECGKEVGSYLYGKGGIEERAVITGGNAISLPDIICFECMKHYPKINPYKIL